MNRRMRWILLAALLSTIATSLTAVLLLPEWVLRYRLAQLADEHQSASVLPALVASGKRAVPHLLVHMERRDPHVDALRLRQSRDWWQDSAETWRQARRASAVDRFATRCGTALVPAWNQGLLSEYEQRAVLRRFYHMQLDAEIDHRPGREPSLHCAMSEVYWLSKEAAGEYLWVKQQVILELDGAAGDTAAQHSEGPTAEWTIRPFNGDAHGDHGYTSSAVFHVAITHLPVGEHTVTLRVRLGPADPHTDAAQMGQATEHAPSWFEEFRTHLYRFEVTPGLLGPAAAAERGRA